MTLPIRLLIVLLIAALATPAWAEWIVARVSPPARYALDGETWVPLSRGMQIPDSAWIHTGRRGRLLLQRSDELIQFKPNTVAAVLSRTDAETSTVLQKFGDIFLDVRAGTRIETPYLGAMVKGSRVQVGVTLDQARLHVQHGVVEATDLVRSQRTDLRAKQQVIAPARADRPLRLAGPGPMAPVVAVAPRKPRVNPPRPARQAQRAAESGAAHRSEERDDVEDRVRFERARIEALARMAREESPDRAEHELGGGGGAGSGGDGSGHGGPCDCGNDGGGSAVGD